MKNKSICPMPFINLDIESSGNIKPCCLFTENIINENNTPYNIEKNSIDEVRNSVYLKNLQQQMLKGKKIEGCIECYNEEKISNYSKRLRELDLHEEFFNKDLKLLDIKLGNICNLKCLICNPTSSSLFNHENKQLQLSYNKKNFKWHQSFAFWNELKKYKYQIKQIDFMGGEPLLDKFHLSFLQFLIKENVSKNINLNFVTNGTIFPSKKTLEIYNEFNKITFTISADGIKNVYEYCRFPAKWNVFEKNLFKYIDYKQYIKVISYSVSMYSLFGIFDALDYYKNLEIKVWFNLVHSDQNLSNIKNLHSNLKEKFIKEYNNRINQEWNSVYNDVSIDDIINFMNVDSNDDKNFKIFLKNTGARDMYRNNNLFNIVPHYSKY